MKKLVIIVLLFAFSNANAQEVVKSIYGDTVIVYRQSGKQISKIKYQGLLDAVLLFEKYLDKLKSSTTVGGYIYADDFAFYKTIIKDNDAKFDFSSYDAEISFYTNYASKRRIAISREKDSIKNAESIAYDKREIRKKIMSDSINLVWHIQDSTERANKKIVQDERSRIYDSTSSANFLAQQKIYKLNCIKKFGVKYGTIISNNDVVLGMNKAMVEESWGLPNTTNETNVKGVRVMTWEYSYKKWAIFKDGIVISVTK